MIKLDEEKSTGDQQQQFDLLNRFSALHIDCVLECFTKVC